MPQKRFRKNEAIYTLVNDYTNITYKEVLPLRMVPSYQIPEISVASVLVADPVPRLRFADLSRFVSPESLSDVSPFHYLSSNSARKNVTAPQTYSTYIYHVLAPQVIQPPSQMSLGAVILGKNSDLALHLREIFECISFWLLKYDWRLVRRALYKRSKLLQYIRTLKNSWGHDSLVAILIGCLASELVFELDLGHPLVHSCDSSPKASLQQVALSAPTFSSSHEFRSQRSATE